MLSSPPRGSYCKRRPSAHWGSLVVGSHSNANVQTSLRVLSKCTLHAYLVLPMTQALDKSGSDKARKKDLADGDPELARYLNRAYWEQRQQQQQTDQNGDPSLASRLSPVPSAPTSAGSPYSTVKAIEASAPLSAAEMLVRAMGHTCCVVCQEKMRVAGGTFLRRLPQKCF